MLNSISIINIIRIRWNIRCTRLHTTLIILIVFVRTTKHTYLISINRIVFIFFKLILLFFYVYNVCVLIACIAYFLIMPLGIDCIFIMKKIYNVQSMFLIFSIFYTDSYKLIQWFIDVCNKQNLYLFYYIHVNDMLYHAIMILFISKVYYIYYFKHSTFVIRYCSNS